MVMNQSSKCLYTAAQKLLAPQRWIKIFCFLKASNFFSPEQG
jgi:hypothetical protein